MASKDIVRFRLTGNRTPISFSIPTKEMMLEKETEGGGKSFKRIHYIPGVDSVWKEDYKGDEKPKKIVFEEGFLDVHKSNKPLLFILRNHKWFNQIYEIVDEDTIAEKELDRMDLIEKALTRVNIANEDELIANALILVGESVVGLTPTRIKAALKKKAFDEPEELINEMNTNDYKAKFAGALAIQREVIFINPTRTAVTWPDGKVIVNVAAGQSPVEKLGAFLSENNEQAKITLQEIGIRSTRAYTKSVEADLGGAVEEALAVSQGSSKDVDGSEIGLEEARSMYKELNDGNEVPNNKKNDLEWILSKLD